MKVDPSLNKNDLVEIARLNVNEIGNVPFPSNKFNIKIWSNDHNPPHFHITLARKPHPSGWGGIANSFFD